MFLLAILLIFSMFAFASCEWLPWGDNEDPCTEHVDANADYVCDNCGAEIEKTDIPDDPIDDPTDKPCTHVDEDKNHKCDACEIEMGEHKAAEGSHICAYCDKAASDCIDENTDHKCDICSAEMGVHKAADGSHICAYCGAEVSQCQDAEDDNDHNCDVCGVSMGSCSFDEKTHICNCGAVDPNYEKLEGFLNIGDLEVGTLDQDLINGRFTISAGSEIRNRNKSYTDPETGEILGLPDSVKLGDDASTVTASVPGTGILYVYVRNGSSSAQTQYIKVTAPDGTVSEIEFPGKSESDPMIKLEIPVTEGDWKINRVSGTVDLHAIGLWCIVEKSEENGFEIASQGIVDYLCGQQLDLSGLVLKATFANGNTAPLAIEDVTIDISAVNMAQSGAYAVKISYKDYAPISYIINVYLPTSITIDYDMTVQEGQSVAGNGMYINKSFKEVYAVGETLNLTGLSVTVNGTLGEATKSFRVENYQVGEVDLSTAGEKLVNVFYIFGTESVSANAEIYVVDTEPSIVEDAYQVKVDQSYDGIVGAVENGYNMFTTVQQALDFLAKAEAGKRKIMIIEAGLYTEKLEITIPNLHIKGVGADKVTIEWNSIYGIKDAGGFSQVTDSTQTVAVRDTATGVTIEGITISNYWNSQERMDEAGLGIERGLALLVQADRFIMKDSALLGIQDTVELFTGRQYFENVFISGYTDFIFGTNNTTLFKNCTIHVIDTEKDDKGTAGYITAFKGSNKGAGDAIVYGAIFEGCKFTADEGVSAGKTAIGRTWGAYAAVAIINSELGGHISVSGYDPNVNKNERYISMNKIHPTDETVQFVEYGNTGAGAITEAVAGMRMLTAEEAARYTDIATIFGKINGGVSYLDPWDPAVTEIVLDDRTYYYFNGTEGTSGISYIYNQKLNGTTGTFGDIAIDATAGKVEARASDTQINAGAKLTFSVKAGTLVVIKTHSGYGNYTLNGVGTVASETYSRYYAEDTEITFLAIGQVYLHYIIIDPNSEAPAEATLSEIKGEGVKINYTVGDELSLEGLVVKAYYSDNSVVTVSDYTIDSSAVNNAAAGSYDVIVSWGGKSSIITVVYEAADVDTSIISKNTTITYGTEGNFETVNGIDHSNITVSTWNADNSQVKNGYLSLKVNANATVSIKAYNGSQYTLSDGTTTVDVVATSDPYVYTNIASGIVTLTLTFGNTGSDYLYSIVVDYSGE